MAIAIKAEHLSKEYRLGTINHGMLFRDMQSWMARKMGKPDPHEKIGAARFDDMPDRFWALKDVNFEIEQGDRVGIIGRNGAGKSTLLKIISRITAPTEGSIKIKGKVVSLLEVGTGFHPELTGRENIFLNGAILGMKKRQVQKKLDEIIAFSEIEKFIDTPAKRYSSGMYVRLAFAVAAHLDSDILLADEVLAVGDSEFQKKSIGKMNDISKEYGRTILFVSHQINFISTLCESALLLNKGKIESIGKTSKVVSEYLNTSNQSGCPEIEYDNNRSKPIAITSISIENSTNEKTSLVKMNEDFSVCIRYSVNESIRSAYIALHIITQTSEMLLDSCDVDLSPNLLKKRECGNYLARIKIPSNFLNAGEYYLEAWAGVPSQSKGFMTTDKLRVTVIDTGSVISTNNPTRKCLLSFPLKWDTEYFL